MTRKFSLFVIVLLLASLACNLPGGAPEEGEGLVFTQAAETLTAVALENESTATSEAETSTPSPTATELSATAPAAATATSLPCNVASFVSDVTIPDNTEFAPGEAFVKTWRLRNDGSCTWTSGYQLVFDSGDQMGGPASQQLTGGSVLPGQTVDISVNLTAPNAAGTYKGNWKIREPGGAVFGIPGPFWVQIKTVSATSSEWPVFRNGDSGPEVYAIQFLLTARGFDTTADGLYGPITRGKVQAFQTSKGLLADGVVGPNTWQALIIQISQGRTGPEVRALQRLLRDKFGFNTVTVDGIFGPATDSAVESFQGSHGLAVDGIVGPQTWKALISE